MTRVNHYLATGSVVALMAAFSIGASAQDNMRDRSGMSDNRGNDACIGVECVPGGNVDRERVNPPGDGDRTQRSRDIDRSEELNREERRVNRNDDVKRRVTRGDDNDRQDSRREARRGDWRYDPNRHHRSRNKDARFRFYYGGYWYAEPYWTLPLYGLSRVSCGEGRAIVDDNGFNRVRTIECSGGTYTYAARRQGDSYRVSLNSRTGEIVRVRPM
jgi:hypothetical protein